MFNKIKEKFNSITKKLNSGFFYIVDRETLINYLNEQIEFANEHNLEMIEELNIYTKNQKYNLSLWDFTKSTNKKEHEKGLSIIFNNKEYHTINNLFSSGTMDGKLLRDIEYFKIELIYYDNVKLNDYKKEHPELTEDFFNQYDI